jgi:hypothetical protein
MPSQQILIAAISFLNIILIKPHAQIAIGQLNFGLMTQRVSGLAVEDVARYSALGLIIL